MKKNKYYYILVSTGLIIVSWNFWTRFLRERTIKEIPDPYFNETKFWILFIICFLCFCSITICVKHLYNEKKNAQNLFQTLIFFIVSFFSKPIQIFDNFIKKTSFIERRYDIFISYLTQYSNKIADQTLLKIIFLFQYLPRIILAIILFCDVFYFSKIEYFYKFLLIGLIPLIFNYIHASIEEYMNKNISLLEEFYSEILVFEKGFEFLVSRTRNSKAVYHFKHKTIREFIEIKFENYLNILCNIDDFEYTGIPTIKHELLTSFAHINYNNDIEKITKQDNIFLKSVFVPKMQQILDAKGYLFGFFVQTHEKLLLFFRLLVMIIYLICWTYILFVNYKNFPIELNNSKYIIFSITKNLLINYENPFI